MDYNIALQYQNMMFELWLGAWPVLLGMWWTKRAIFD